MRINISYKFITNVMPLFCCILCYFSRRNHMFRFRHCRCNCCAIVVKQVSSFNVIQHQSYVNATDHNIFFSTGFWDYRRFSQACFTNCINKKCIGMCTALAILHEIFRNISENIYTYALFIIKHCIKTYCIIQNF